MTDHLRRQIESFLDTARKARTAEPRERRESIQRLLVRRANALREIRDDLGDKLDRGWVYLEANPGDEEIASHEDRWIDWLHDLEAIEEALGNASDAWLGPDVEEAA